jgi:acyl-CoA thioester hydrolase
VFNEWDHGRLLYAAAETLSNGLEAPPAPGHTAAATARTPIQVDRPPPATRQKFRVFYPMPTRWMDNDVYGHVNNVVYYAWFDSAVNRFLIDAGTLDIAASPTVGLVVETGCRYHASVAFPDEVAIGLAVAHLGRSSVRYELAVFRAGEDAAAAEAHFVHVYVDRATQRPVPIPAQARAAMRSIMAEP